MSEMKDFTTLDFFSFRFGSEHLTATIAHVFRLSQIMTNFYLKGYVVLKPVVLREVLGSITMRVPQNPVNIVIRGE